MSELKRVPSERYYLHHERVMALGLVVMLCLGANMLVVLYGREAGEGVGPGALIIVAVYFLAVFVVSRLTLRRRGWGLRDPEAMAVVRDEWVRENTNRAQRTAFWVVLGAQLPMMFIMSELPAGRSVLGMGNLTVFLGLAAFFGSYLYFSRQPVDG